MAAVLTSVKIVRNKNPRQRMKLSGAGKAILSANTWRTHNKVASTERVPCNAYTHKGSGGAASLAAGRALVVF
jgi:hypothetical protein